ncbi:MAG: hypothetical protein P8M08_06245, partial [Akkermansiaceae bacterium]|nr:hypothetical protein [Akkermansiaceae bacterium]
MKQMTGLVMGWWFGAPSILAITAIDLSSDSKLGLTWNSNPERIYSRSYEHPLSRDFISTISACPEKVNFSIVRIMGFHKNASLSIRLISRIHITSLNKHPSMTLKKPIFTS